MTSMNNGGRFQGSHLLFGGNDQQQEFTVTETTRMHSRVNRRGDTQVRTTTTTTYAGSPTSQQQRGGFPGHQLVTQMVGQNNNHNSNNNNFTASRAAGNGDGDDAPDCDHQLVMEVCTNTTMSSADGSPSGRGGKKKKRGAFKDRKRARRKEEFLLASASRGGILHLATSGGSSGGSGRQGRLSAQQQQNMPQVFELIQLAPTASAMAPIRSQSNNGGSQAKNKRLAKKAAVSSQGNATGSGRKKNMGGGTAGVAEAVQAHPEELVVQLQLEHDLQQQQPNWTVGPMTVGRQRGGGSRHTIPSEEDEVDEHLHFDAPFETPTLSPKPSPQAMPVLVALPSSSFFGNNGVTDQFVELESDDLFDALVI